MPKDSFSTKCICYKNQSKRDFSSFSLIVQALGIFKKIYIVENLFAVYKNYIQRFPYEETKRIFDNIFFDKIMVVICMENIFKALLIKKGYLVHMVNKRYIKDKKLDPLRNPVKVSVLKKIIKPIYDTTSYGYWDYRELKEQTIGFSNILNKYSDILNIDMNLINVLKQYNKDRNNLHFYIGQSCYFSSNLGNEISEICKYIDIYVLKFSNKFAEKNYKSPKKECFKFEPFYNKGLLEAALKELKKPKGVAHS